MLSLLPVVVLLAAAAPAPAPTASEPPTKLQEIGRTRATVCTSIVVHANGVIAQALENDRTLAILTTNLRTMDFDKLNWMQRRNAFDGLMKQTQQIRTAFPGADGEIKTLRKLAETSPDPQRKRELKAFADALGGALERQKRVATDFDRSVVIMRGREEAQEARSIEHRDTRMVSPASISRRGLDRLDAIADGAAPPAPLRDGEFNHAMRDLAATLDLRIEPIAFDEGTAADHSIAATTGC